MDMFERRQLNYKNSLGCNNKTCNGCFNLELTSKKCTKYDAKNAYAYWGRYDFKGDFPEEA